MRMSSSPGPGSGRARPRNVNEPICSMYACFIMYGSSFRTFAQPGVKTQAGLSFKTKMHASFRCFAGTLLPPCRPARCVAVHNCNGSHDKTCEAASGTKRNLPSAQQLSKGCRSFSSGRRTIDCAKGFLEGCFMKPQVMPVKLNEARDKLVLLDQTKLPVEERWIELDRLGDVWEAIKTLRVRGAPAIGIAAAFGLYIHMRQYEATSVDAFEEEFNKAKDYLATSRPTAVNLL